MELNDLKLDVDSYENGAFFPFGEKCKIKIAGWGNKKHAARIREMQRKYGKQLEVGLIDDERANEILAQQWQDIILDWVGMTENGDEIPYSVERVIAIASDQKFSAFLKKITDISKDETNYREITVKQLGEI